jgi:osmoprotectant transport system substrate-binding protein
VYAPAPIIRSEVLEKNPEIATMLEPVFKSLQLETLQLLNSRIAVEGQSPREVASAYLKEKGFL